MYMDPHKYYIYVQSIQITYIHCMNNVDLLESFSKPDTNGKDGLNSAVSSFSMWVV